MMNTSLLVSVENTNLEPFDDRIDILFRELELATKWQRPSVLFAVYSSEYVRADADIALENRLHSLGQSAYHIKIKNQEGADVCLQISELAGLDNVVFFVEGLRWGANQAACNAYLMLNNRREFFIENKIRVVLWLTEKEAMDLAHFAPDYWCFRHRVIEFVDSPNPNQDSPDILESAWQWTGDLADSDNDLDEKIALRTALLTDLPAGNESTSARAHLLLTLGILHWRRGDHEKATHFVNTALDLAARLENDTFEALCFNALALVQTDLGRTEEAIQAYQNAINLAPEQIYPWNNLGHLHKKLGRHAEALEAFQKAIEHNATDAVSWNGLGDLYHETGRNDDAIYAYLKAIEFSPDFAPSWSGLGNSRLDEGQVDEALSAHLKAIEIDRRAVKSWLGVGNICKLRDDEDKAVKAYRAALELDPRNKQAWNELGNLFYKKGAYDDAMLSYQKSIEFNETCSQTYNNQAAIYIQKGLHKAAIPLLLRGLELSDKTADTASLWNHLGDTYRRLDDYENAMAAYRKADMLGPRTELPANVQPPATDEPQSMPIENPEQSELQLEFEPAREVPMPAEAPTPDLAAIPSVPIFAEDADNNSARPDHEFLDWLDGLASVLPVEQETDQGEAEETGLDENEDDYELGSGYLATPASEQALPDALGYEYSQELSTNKPENEAFPGLPFGELASDESGLPMGYALPSEESELFPANDDQGIPIQAGATISDEIAPLGTLDNPEDNNENQGSIDEKNAQIWNELGNIYYNTGAFDEAMHAFEMAIQLDPSNGWSYNNLASIHFHQKRYAEAIPLYQDALQLLDNQKDKALLWNRVGDTYRRMDQPDQASAAYRKAIELNPENVSLLTRARFSLLGNLRA
jgi:tetratricopeptide (TPR) repeat protein